MSQGAQAFVILLLLLPLWALLYKQFILGVAFTTLLCVSVSPFLRVTLPGALPELTLHRAALISLLIFWLRQPNTIHRLREVPLRAWILLWLGIATISLLGTVDFSYSLKRYLDLAFERFFFYFLLATSVCTVSDSRTVQRGVWFGLVIVAFLAICERHTGFNPVEIYLTGAEAWEHRSDVTATYQHRILLGVGMAMAWPLSFALLRDSSTGPGFRKVIWGCTVAIFAASYFSMSRGPWVGTVVGAGVIWFLGSRRLRGYLVSIGSVAVVLLILNPGVVITLWNFAKDTADVSSFKGGSFMWRFELWRIAWDAVTVSPWRFLFGYGPASGHTLDLSWEWTFRDRETVVDSWDNQYAYYLFQTGIIGFLGILFLFYKLWKTLYHRWGKMELRDREVMTCILASIAILLFMMTNVLIFARQLDYLFWALVACAFAESGFWSEKENLHVSVAENPVSEIPVFAESWRD